MRSRRVGDGDGQQDCFYDLYVPKVSRRNLSFGLLLGAVAARASCYLRCGPRAPKLGLLQPHGRAVTSDVVLGFRNWDCCSLTGEGRGSSKLRFPLGSCASLSVGTLPTHAFRDASPRRGFRESASVGSWPLDTPMSLTFEFWDSGVLRTARLSIRLIFGTYS